MLGGINQEKHAINYIFFNRLTPLVIIDCYLEGSNVKIIII